MDDDYFLLGTTSLQAQRRATLVAQADDRHFHTLLEKARIAWNHGTTWLGRKCCSKTLFFDNEPLLSHFVRVFIDPDTLPVLRRVSVKFNRICKIHWKSAFKRPANRKFGSMVITSTGMGFCGNVCTLQLSETRSC